MSPHLQVSVSCLPYAVSLNFEAVHGWPSVKVAMLHLHAYVQLLIIALYRYDTIDEQGLWHGAALIVTADAGSVYEPHPHLTYEWDPTLRVSGHARKNTLSSFDLGPHPADPHSTILPSSPSPTDYYASNGTASTFHQSVAGQEIWVYGGQGGYVLLPRAFISL